MNYPFEFTILKLLYALLWKGFRFREFRANIITIKVLI